MNQLQMFDFDKHSIRVIEKNGTPWFVATDVCDVLSLTNPTMALSRLDNDERTKFNLGRQGETNIVNEYGLYSLILASRKPEAKQFKRWVTHEVIPSIRKHGAYMTPDTLEQAIANPDFTIGLLTSLKEERLKREAFEALIEHQKPKVLFADAVQASHTSILVGDLAKLLKQNGIDVGQKRLFEWLRENGYLVKRKGSDYNSPTQKSMELGLFEIKETPVHHNSGSISISKTSKVTGKGQVYFINKFLGKVVAI
ncbi:phage antirepressor KilAC domain-containing protein [Psychrobacillus sp. Sa2BUA9]|uniref:Phage antirepressor KilAC domain-containing protein n=1 Tax=Psychrobacillus faecigallinarum TaxID=2762235 RepID=A0ABR8RAC0_9BACI|nr:phage antirepressor KilAC domain-containing protein [Psychrobacillus faecigallinarum]MBD7944748.1 phage antirepressor KilAC domain-containing protein [Psychrobacillus faecigallinarum]